VFLPNTPIATQVGLAGLKAQAESIFIFILILILFFGLVQPNRYGLG
jgi:hypothetical protein